MCKFRESIIGPISPSLFTFLPFFRLQTLTDSELSDQHTDAKQHVKWLCKPRLNGFLKQDGIHVTTQLSARRGGRKRAVISSSSDEKPESDEERVIFWRSCND